jgi:hypothetical protein
MKNLLHVYAQDFQHDELVVVGDAAGIETLRRVLAGEKLAVDEMPMCADGEGFSIRVIEVDEATMSALPCPYTADEPRASDDERWASWRNLVLAEEEVSDAPD